jgi:metal-responsive CopG/Arc/MetJ family transcriptional regulator
MVETASESKTVKVQVRIPSDLAKALDAIGVDHGGRSEVMRIALDEFIAKATRERALDEFVAGIEPPVTKAEIAAMRERLA